MTLQPIAAADVVLPAGMVERVDALINLRTVSGPRYNPGNQADVDTEEFA